MSDDRQKDQPVDASVVDAPVISSLPPLVSWEHGLGVQVNIGGAVKEKLSESAASLLKARAEALLQEVVLKSRGIATLEQPGVLDSRIRPEDITRAFDRTVIHYAQRGEKKSRFWNFIHELPILLFAVGLTKFVEGALGLMRLRVDPSAVSAVAVDMTVASIAVIVALLLFLGLSQRE
ncbi:MAG: hypothetical protein WBX38_12265 [Candidatus Sulfotelmatobacter sp.]